MTYLLILVELPQEFLWILCFPPFFVAIEDQRPVVHAFWGYLNFELATCVDRDVYAERMEMP